MAIVNLLSFLSRMHMYICIYIYEISRESLAGKSRSTWCTCKRNEGKKKKKERKERKKEKPKSLVSYSTVSIFDFCFNLFRDSAPPELVDARPPLYQRI